MHLAEILRLRPVPAAGLFLSLTRRCPLKCSHCATNSMFTSEDHGDEIFLNFVNSFTVDNHPELVLLTGGEPFLKPRLIQQIAEKAHAVGTQVSVISGMFFARHPRIPLPIAEAIAHVDHFTASLDVFHEEQVSRSSVFRVLQELVDRGKDVSIQVVGYDEKDPYLRDVTDDIQRTFGSSVPVLVAGINAVGRARDLLSLQDVAAPPGVASPAPCTMAAWPTVAYDGTVVACCNQTVVDGPPPPHLRLGHIRDDDWPTIGARCLRSSTLRALRVLGPTYIAQEFGNGAVGCDGYCSTCQRLSEGVGIERQLNALVSAASMSNIEKDVVTLQQRNPQYGLPAYSHLASLGFGGE